MRRSSVLALLFIANLAGPNWAQVPPKKLPLEFHEVKALAAAAVKERQLPFSDPVILSKLKVGARKVLYIYPGNLDRFDDADYPIDTSVLGLQLRLELFRQRLFEDEASRRLVANACEQAEKRVDSIIQLRKNTRLSDLERQKRTEDEERAFWAGFYRICEVWADRQGQTFGGFLSEGLEDVWTPNAKTFSPFNRIFERAFFITLNGPAGVDVFIMTKLKHRLYTLKNIPRKDWGWGQPYVLDPKEPPKAFVTIGANYCVSVRRGQDIREFEKRIVPEDRQYKVPLP